MAQTVFTNNKIIIYYFFLQIIDFKELLPTNLKLLIMTHKIWQELSDPNCTSSGTNCIQGVQFVRKVFPNNERTTLEIVFKCKYIRFSIVNPCGAMRYDTKKKTKIDRR